MTKFNKAKVNRHLARIRTLIGNTPLYPISKAFSKRGVSIYAKLEWNQLGGSIKTRAAFNIIKAAIQSGELKPGMRILDSTSGNTGISYATIGTGLDIPTTILMSETASKERSVILRSLGTEIIYMPSTVTGDQSQLMALELSRQDPDKYFYANQFGNENNWLAHYHSTAAEIYKQTKGKITHFAAALGTTGTLVGTGRRLQEWNPGIQIIALQPDVSTHTIEGWKHLASSNPPGIFDASLPSRTETISTAESYEWVKRVALQEGLLISPSSAAALAGAVKVAESIDSGVVVTVFPDSADKYGAALTEIAGR